MPSPYVPYCGTPPLPGAVAWNFDPMLILALLGVASLHLYAIRRSPPLTQVAAGAGWLVVAIALVSPLCNLSVALFSARVGQHMLIALVGAPLIALSLGRGSQEASRRSGSGGLLLPCLAFAVLLWLWHMPGPYDATLKSDVVYWAMHLTLFAAAIWLWDQLLATALAGFGAALLASFLTGLQMTVLGALLTLAPRPLFAAHFATTEPWGLSPLEDQQLGGLIMWVPAGVLLAAYALAVFGVELRRMERRGSPPLSR